MNLTGEIDNGLIVLPGTDAVIEASGEQYWLTRKDISWKEKSSFEFVYEKFCQEFLFQRLVFNCDLLYFHNGRQYNGKLFDLQEAYIKAAKGGLVEGFVIRYLRAPSCYGRETWDFKDVAYSTGICKNVISCGEKLLSWIRGYCKEMSEMI